MALARARCLYCGALLPAALQAAEAAPRGAPVLATGLPSPPGDGSDEPRLLLVLDAGGAEAGALARGLGLSPYEAGQRVRRGGYQLLKVLGPEPAQAEAAQLEREGLRAFLLPEAEVRVARAPRLALSGRVEEGALVLQLEEGTARILPAAMLLLVKGPIAREYQTTADVSGSRGLRRVRAATLESGFLFHLHLRDHTRPIEIDPAAFNFGKHASPTSSLFNVQALVAAVAAGSRQDDDFRRLPPALAPAAAARGPVSAAEALRASGLPGGGRSPILDNSRQFREHSAWRGTLERRLA